MRASETRSFTVWDKLKESFNSLADLRFKDGLTAITKLGAEAIAAAVNYAGGYELYNVLKNPNLKPRQKIIPVIGYGLSVLVGVPAVIALIAGAGMLVPPFMFAASVVAVVRNVGTYLEERSERNNLRKELIKSNELLNKIEKADVSDENKTHILNSILGQRHIYLDLYALRHSLIVSSQLPFEDKQRLVEAVNAAIEKFSRGELQELDIDLQSIPESLKAIISEKVDNLAFQLNDYNIDTLAVKEMDLPKSLRTSIDIYKYTQENIYSQDLPLDIKREMVLILEGKKIHKRALNDLYLRIGQHYLNNTSLEQLKVQDDNRKIQIMDFTQNENELSNCVNFYQKPREVYIALHALHNCILHHDFSAENEKAQLLTDIKKFTTAFKHDPALSDLWLSQFQEKFANVNSDIQPAIQRVFQELSSFDEVVKQYHQSTLFSQQMRLKQLTDPSDVDQKKLAKLNVLIRSLEEHQLNSLQQFSSQYGQQFNVPRIQIDHKRYDLIAAVSHKMDDKWNISERFMRIAKKANTSALKRLFSSSHESTLETQDQLNNQQSQMKSDFKERYLNTFVLMDKKQRLNYLEKSVPRRLLNVGIASVVALASLATTFLIPAIASPAAPAAATATVVIGAISTGLVVASAMNSADLIRRELKGKMKVEQARNNIKEAIIPSLSDSANKKAVEHERLRQQHEIRPEPILPLESMALHTNHRSMHDALKKEIGEHSKLRDSEIQEIKTQENSDNHHRLH